MAITRCRIFVRQVARYVAVAFEIGNPALIVSLYYPLMQKVRHLVHNRLSANLHRHLVSDVYAMYLFVPQPETVV